MCDASVIVDPRIRVSYTNFYVQGFASLLGWSAVHQTAKPFRELHYASMESHEHYAAFVLQRDARSVRLVIDFRDKLEVDEPALAWADLYAKVNCTEEQVKEQGLIPIGPGFGIRLDKLWGWRPDWVTRQIASHRLAAGRGEPGPALRYQLADWGVTQLRSEPISAYSPGTSDPDYAFYAASLWQHANCVEETNPWRAAWMRALRDAPGMTVEGGFIGADSDPQWSRYADLRLRERVPLTDWIRKTQRSAVVFNNPAVWGCHGWKLAQFCSLGKAIITTSLSGPLPAPFEDGAHAHFVTTPEELPEALSRCREDHVYRKRLEEGAWSYWRKNLAPVAQARRLLQSAFPQ